MIEWRTTYFQSAGTANFEVILPEDSATLSVIYGQTADSGSAETSGIQASDNGGFTQFSCGEATLASGLRVNYVPSGCPAGATLINIGDNFFDPADVTIPTGTTVCWTNNGQVTHTATSDTGAFDSGFMSPGDMFTFTFNNAGSYPYHCVIHGALMTGTITVNTGPPPPPPPPPASSSASAPRHLRRLRHRRPAASASAASTAAATSASTSASPPPPPLRHLRLRHRSGAAYRGSSGCVSPPRRRRSGVRTARSATCDASALAARCGAAS